MNSCGQWTKETHYKLGPREPLDLWRYHTFFYYGDISWLMMILYILTIMKYISWSMHCFDWFWFHSEIIRHCFSSNLYLFQPAVRLWWQRLSAVWETPLFWNHPPFSGVIFCCNWSKGSSDSTYHEFNFIWWLQSPYLAVLVNWVTTRITSDLVVLNVHP